ncbi:hypothetical protein M0G43_12065 [Subsaxibacter sp. CAU 1640]|uniref:hypothetical protein n=1 Tax=Subsaxibacter sp. CAU 1640 TaxID=2933271 RepID=UPI00200457A1|nr:hypothetical protein [Subsaxibacter sp. CAU 1640]MCK7591313.1 hypothetical protein [Subsaxibacter sp. CAU 1640]
MVVRAELSLPFWTQYLDSEDIQVPNRITFNGTEFKLSTQRINNDTNVAVTFEIPNLVLPINEIILERIKDNTINLVNHYIYHARTFDHYSTDIVMVSPRSVQEIRIQIKNDETLIYDDNFLLKQTHPKYFQEYFDMLNEPGAFDVFEDLVSNNNHLLYINLIFDSYYALYDGRFNESILNCCTAIESMIIPILSEWFSKQLFHKKLTDANRILMEIPMALKYEMLFGSIKGDYLRVHPKLLEKAKEMHKTRNKIVHTGFQASKAKAELFLNTASKIIMILHFNMEPECFKDEEKE